MTREGIIDIGHECQIVRKFSTTIFLDSCDNRF